MRYSARIVIKIKSSLDKGFTSTITQPKHIIDKQAIIFLHNIPKIYLKDLSYASNLLLLRAYTVDLHIARYARSFLYLQKNVQNVYNVMKHARSVGKEKDAQIRIHTAIVHGALFKAGVVCGRQRKTHLQKEQRTKPILGQPKSCGFLDVCSSSSMSVTMSLSKGLSSILL